MSDVSFIRPEAWRWAEDAGYSQAARVGDLVVTCGVAPLDDDGNLVGEGDFEAQLRRVVDNVRVLLAAGGAELESIVRQQVFLTRASDLEAFRRVRRELYRPPYPCSIVVVVSELALPGMLVEIACEAVRRGPRTVRGAPTA